MTYTNREVEEIDREIMQPQLPDLFPILALVAIVWIAHEWFENKETKYLPAYKG